MRTGKRRASSGRLGGRTAAAAFVAVFGLGACVGSIGDLPGEEDSAGAPGGPSFGGAGNFPAGTGGALPPTPEEEAMRAANPTLLDRAMKYFPGREEAAAGKRVFRLTREQLEATARTLLPGQFGEAGLAAMPRDPRVTNYEYAENLGFSAASFTPYVNWVSELAGRVRTNPAAVVDCAASGDSPACLAEAAKRFVNRAFRGVAPPETLERFAAFYLQSVAEVGLADAAADLVDLAMSSPFYVFREEMRTDVTGALMPAARLQQVTYTLADAPPEGLGLPYDAPDTLVGTPDAVARTVEAVLASPAARQKLLRFFVSWLEVREPDAFTIDAQAFPEFTPEVAAGVVEETRAFLERQLAGAVPRLPDVTEALPAGADPAQRFGVFTLPAVIASHSGPTTTRLVKRGVFFTRKVMCLPLGLPPADVDRTVPATTDATERQKIEALTAGSSRCMGCHAYINPFGFMQENYDPLGRFRTLDNGKPVDASISVDFLDEGPFVASSAVEALRGFTQSVRFQQCFTRQLFRFYMGRDEVPGDDPLLRRMFFDFADGGSQEILGMLRTLTGSPAFSLRSEAP